MTDTQKTWVASWAASVQGPYPVGNPSAQPDQSVVFPDTGAAPPSARDQTFRLIVRPTLWGREARIRLSNVFGTKPLAVNGTFIGLHLGSAAVIAGTSRPVTFGGSPRVTIAPGTFVRSDPVALAVRDPDAPELAGRKLAVSFHVAGDSGPMSWHAKALQSCYVTPPGSGAHGADESEAAFPYSTASWFFLDALEMAMPAGCYAIACLGDSITDGTFSTMSGDDRWPDVLARRLSAQHGNRVGVINAGIGGNQIAGPSEYGPAKPYPGGPAAVMRIDRDVLDLAGVGVLIWLEGTNDFSRNGCMRLDPVIAAQTQAVARIRAKRPDIRIIAATVTTALGSTNPNHGFPEQDANRRALNEHIRTSGLFDAAIDFDAATRDPATGRLKAEFVPDSTTGGPGDWLHPNRAGYHAMAHAIDLALLTPKRA